jgi:hypothetical protein
VWSEEREERKLWLWYLKGWSAVTVG